jgi:hypothetical protein
VPLKYEIETALGSFMPADESASIGSAKLLSKAAPGPVSLHINGVQLESVSTTPVSVQPKCTPPTDGAASPTVRQCLAWYGGAIALTCAILFAGLRLDSLTLTAPLMYDDDALLIMPMVKATLERGSHWRNERMGYPGVLELHDFPVIDHLHFSIIQLIGWFVSDWIIVYNLYYLLTYPLTTLTAMYAFRRLGLTLPMAAAGGILYSFLPYHYMRGEAHYFLAAYWLVPLSWLPALAISRGDFPFFRLANNGEYRFAFRAWRTFWQVVLAIGTASAGAYYAFFACAIYAFAGAYGWAAHRTWKAAAAAAILTALIVAIGIVNHLPAIAYEAEYGRNSVAERYPEEAETYGLKIAHLVLPVDGHNVTFLGRVKSGYHSHMRPLDNENSASTLGIVGTIGLVILLTSLLLSRRRTWPYGPLSAFAIFIILFATIGGIGSVFNLLVFDQVRCLNRISIYLAFICQFAALWPLDRFLLSRTGRLRRLRIGFIAALAVIGITDQTPTPWFAEPMLSQTRKEQYRFMFDREFFSDIEAQLLSGSRNPLEPDAPPRVFMLPYMPFPEVPPLFDMNAYEHARGYLHTKFVVWSYGAIKNREVDAWQRDVIFDDRNPASPAQYLIPRIIYRGFDGILIDTRGFPFADHGNKGAQLLDKIKDMARQAGVKIPEISHDDKRQVFLDLRPYRDYLWNLDRATFEDGATREREWVALTWLRGFVNHVPGTRYEDSRWGYESGRATIVNPSARTRTFRLSMRFGVDASGGFLITIDGNSLIHRDRRGGSGPLSDSFVIEKPEPVSILPKHWFGEPRIYVLEIPPGRHSIAFRCRTPRQFMPSSVPAICYYIKDVRFVEIK